MAEWKQCWVSKSGHHFGTQEEANQHDKLCDLDDELIDILDTCSKHTRFMVRENRKVLYQTLKEYYKMGGK